MDDCDRTVELRPSLLKWRKTEGEKFLVKCELKFFFFHFPRQRIFMQPHNLAFVPGVVAGKTACSSLEHTHTHI